MKFKISSNGVSDTGHVRTRNEDSMLVHANENIWAIADGMGGHHAGDFASQTIVKTLSLFKQLRSLNESINSLEEHILDSNLLIRNKSSKLGPNATIGSTVVCTFLWGKYIFVFWAGDSRLYRYREGQLLRLTEDHSYVEELVKMGKLDAKNAEKHPAANVVLNAVGIADQLRLDFEYFEIQVDDIYLLCSDGLYKDLNEQQIKNIIDSSLDDMTVLSERLLSSSLDAGGTDNTSIVMLKVNSGNSD